MTLCHEWFFHWVED